MFTPGTLSLGNSGVTVIGMVCVLACSNWWSAAASVCARASLPAHAAANAPRACRRFMGSTDALGAAR